MKWTCSAAALEKIIAAVGEKYSGELDRDRLVFDLQDAWSRWLLFTALDSDEGARARKELFSAILDSATNFREHLLDPRGEMYAAKSIFLSQSRLEAFVAELDNLIGAAKDLEQQDCHGGWVRLERPPKEWIAGKILAQVFERNFNRLPKVSHDPNTGKIYGPFIRFVVAVTTDWGIPMKDAVIARALRDVKAGKERRKRRPTTLTRRPNW